MRIRKVLISVSDKSGIGVFAQVLSRFGVEFISTGGTANSLTAAGLQVTEVAQFTGFPEIMDGRVKTINPRIAGGILAIRGNKKHMLEAQTNGIAMIDMVVVNLYPFEQIAAKPGATFEELIENIDIGGPTLVRAAAKNWQDVAIVTSPNQYGVIAEEITQSGHGSLSTETLWRLSVEALTMIAKYDVAIAAELQQRDSSGKKVNKAKLPLY